MYVVANGFWAKIYFKQPFEHFEMSFTIYLIHNVSQSDWQEY